MNQDIITHKFWSTFNSIELKIISFAWQRMHSLFEMMVKMKGLILINEINSNEMLISNNRRGGGRRVTRQTLLVSVTQSVQFWHQCNPVSLALF